MEEAFTKYDADADGKLSQEEFTALVSATVGADKAEKADDKAKKS